MALLNILHYPDPRLKNVASPVDEVSEEIRKLLDDMLETMYDAPGIGLAATQVNIPKRLIVIDISEQKNSPLYLVNPEIVRQEGDTEMEEGCLSVPGIFASVDRANQIEVKALGKDGEIQEFTADGLLAICIQHEIDHLNGVLFIDYLSEIRRQRIKKKLQKQARQTM
ncbi:MAG TPA: peptide deformylase [Gammaproteobacteria bacterium]|nr:peptide deformylase [Gammaproteobacteria bacterium]